MRILTLIAHGEINSQGFNALEFVFSTCLLRIPSTKESLNLAQFYNYLHPTLILKTLLLAQSIFSLYPFSRKNSINPGLLSFHFLNLNLQASASLCRSSTYIESNISLQSG